MISFKLFDHSFIERMEAFMATQAEVVAVLNEVNGKLEKIGGETKTLLTKIDELVANCPHDVSPELQAAVDAVKAQAESVDALVADAPTPTPE